MPKAKPVSHAPHGRGGIQVPNCAQARLAAAALEGAQGAHPSPEAPTPTEHSPDGTCGGTPPLERGMALRAAHHVQGGKTACGHQGMPPHTGGMVRCAQS